MTGPSLWRMLLPFAAGYYLSYLLRTVNAVIAPDLTSELALSASDLGLLTSAYFFSFGAFQIPLGVLLDRFGPRRVEAALLLICAAGAAVFAVGHSLAVLGLGRALIGLGVSACLMASFKSFSQWFPAERQPSLVGAIMVSGSLGALSASLPLEAALPVIGWRGLFATLAVVAVAVAGLILTVPHSTRGLSAEPFGVQLTAVREVFANRRFWRFAPQTTLVTGGFMAIQGLWAVPWLMTVNGYERSAAATHLFYLNVALLIGFMGIAGGAARLAQRGFPPQLLLPTGSCAAIGVGVLIATDAGPSALLWTLFGFAICTGNLAYPLVAAEFAAERAGRVSTALNLLAFVGAFSVQWGFGAAVDALQAAGFTPAQSFRISFLCLLAAQAGAVAWYAVESRHATTH